MAFLFGASEALGASLTALTAERHGSSILPVLA